jgi:hypothetical protein
MFRKRANAIRCPLLLLITPSLLLLLPPLLCMLLLQESRAMLLLPVLPVVLAPRETEGKPFWV